MNFTKNILDSKKKQFGYQRYESTIFMKILKKIYNTHVGIYFYLFLFKIINLVLYFLRIGIWAFWTSIEWS